MSDLQDIEFEVNIEENLDEIIEEIELEISPLFTKISKNYVNF